MFSQRLFLAIVFIGIIILVSYPITVQSYEERSPREVLLNLYSQELVAHGAMFFAATAAAFRFVTHLVKESNNKGFMVSRRSVIFTLISGILLAFVIFLGFRILYYGALANTTIYFRPPTENETVGDYALTISYDMGNTIGDSCIDELRWNLVKSTFKGIMDFRLFSILPVSLYLGFFLSFLMSLGFSDNDFDRPLFWFFFFALPAVIGFAGALCYLSKTLDVILTLAPFIYYTLIPVLYYLFVHKNSISKKRK